MICPNCHNSIDDGLNYCPACGQPLPDNSSVKGHEWICSYCHASNPDSLQTCQECGSVRTLQNHNKWWTIGIVILLIPLLYLAAGLILPDVVPLPFSVESAESGKTIIYSDQAAMYRVLVSRTGYSEPFSSQTNGKKYAKDSLISITQTAEQENGSALYGKAGDSWLLMEDADGIYMQKEPLTSSQTESAKSQTDTEAAHAEESGTSSSSEAAAKDKSRKEDNHLEMLEESAPELQSSIELPIRQTTRLKDYYSGPACAAIILDLKGVSVSQSVIAEQAGTEAEKLTDYNKLAAVLTQQLKDHHINAQYDGFLINSSEMSSSVFSQFEQRIQTNLQNKYPSIIDLNLSPVGGVNEDRYGVLFGMNTYSDGTKDYKVFLPADGGEIYTFSQATLQKCMLDTGYFCYLY